MGSSLSLLWGSSNDNVVDPATGLTIRQKKLVQSTWALIRKDPVGSGCAIMMAFFKAHPDYQQAFAGFKHVPLDQLPTNKKFQAHCLSVVTMLSNIIDSMNDPGLLEANLLSIGEKHSKRGQTKEQFHHLKEVVMEVLKVALGAKFTPEVSEAWSKTLDVAYSVIFTAYST